MGWSTERPLQSALRRNKNPRRKHGVSRRKIPALSAHFRSLFRKTPAPRSRLRRRPHTSMRRLVEQTPPDAPKSLVRTSVGCGVFGSLATVPICSARSSRGLCRASLLHGRFKKPTVFPRNLVAGHFRGLPGVLPCFCCSGSGGKISEETRKFRISRKRVAFRPKRVVVEPPGIRRPPGVKE